MMPAGRPSDYTPELVEEFCRRVASGRSILSVCTDIDMPADTTIYRWRQEKPEFRDKLTSARDERLEAYADQIMALGRRAVEDLTLDHNRINSAVNAIDKAARLQAPKQRVELTGKDGGPVEHKDVSARDILASRIASLAERREENAGNSEPDGSAGGGA